MSIKWEKLINIDRRSNTLLSRQITDSMKHLIVTKRILFGKELPREDDLATLLEVNLSEVQESYKHLVIEQFITKNEKASIVSYTEMSDLFFEQLVNLSAAIEKSGLNVSTDLIDQKTNFLTQEQKTSMGFSAHDDISMDRRVYYGSQRPYFVIDAYYSTCTNRGKSIRRDHTFTVETMSKDIMRLLDNQMSHPGLVSIMKGYDSSGIQIDYQVTWCHHSIYFNISETLENKKISDLFD